VKKKILITGVAGYIGSSLNNYLYKKEKVYSLDKENPNKWTKFKKKFFFKCNLLNKKKLEKIIEKLKPDLIIHLAGKSTVNEKIPYQKYFLNNVITMRNLLSVMKKYKIDKIIYSSTAAVYNKKNNFIGENDKLNPISNYGKSKLKAERLLRKNKNLDFIILRFFNVSSSIPNPLIGEFHKPETHLIPTLIHKTLEKKKINIFGNNYKTSDGTCMRDYVHIIDICRAIIFSKNYLFKKKNKKIILNIGNGKAISIKQIINELKNNFKLNLKIKYIGRRKGDSPFLVCNINKAKKIIKWKPIYSKIIRILKDEVKWSKYLIKSNNKRLFIK
jgi:UDP-glucose 4-epimerase